MLYKLTFRLKKFSCWNVTPFTLTTLKKHANLHGICCMMFFLGCAAKVFLQKRFPLKKTFTILQQTTGVYIKHNAGEVLPSHPIGTTVQQNKIKNFFAVLSCLNQVCRDPNARKVKLVYIFPFFHETILKTVYLTSRHAFQHLFFLPSPLPLTQAIYLITLVYCFFTVLFPAAYLK